MNTLLVGQTEAPQFQPIGTQQPTLSLDALAKIQAITELQFMILGIRMDIAMMLAGMRA